jgi:hypothetical protein
MNFDMEMDVVVDKVWAEEAEEFAGTGMAAAGGANEFQNALAGGDDLKTWRRGDPATKCMVFMG